MIFPPAFLLIDHFSILFSHPFSYSIPIFTISFTISFYHFFHLNSKGMQQISFLLPFSKAFKQRNSSNMQANKRQRTSQEVPFSSLSFFLSLSFHFKFDFFQILLMTITFNPSFWLSGILLWHLRNRDLRGKQKHSFCQTPTKCQSYSKWESFCRWIHHQSSPKNRQCISPFQNRSNLFPLNWDIESSQNKK